MLGVDEALALIRACCTQLPAERVALTQACGRVLAETIHAPRALPPFDNSAMDGFAIRWQPELGPGSVLPVLAEQAAGDGSSHQSSGACSIMTGARIPDGLDTVVAVEDCTVLTRDAAGQAQRIALTIAPRCGQHVRCSGEDIALGERVLEAGTRLSDEAVMVLRGIGMGEVAVRRRPRLVLACTGRELVDSDGATLQPGQIANTNGPYLERLLAASGAEVVQRLTLPDEPAVLAAHYRRWFDAGIELVVTTGAVSMGRYDFIPDVLREIGATLHFHKLRMRPGKPLLFATAGLGSLVFGLPGNPISSALGARFFVDAAVRALTGQLPEVGLVLPLEFDGIKRPGFSVFQKADCVLAPDGRLVVRLLKGQESFKTAPLLAARAWALLTEAADALVAGTPVSVYSLRPQAGGIATGPNQ
jgi:molybdopterin molybdotransferase